MYPASALAIEQTTLRYSMRSPDPARPIEQQNSVCSRPAVPSCVSNTRVQQLRNAFWSMRWRNM